jgi:hypothetical protein
MSTVPVERISPAARELCDSYLRGLESSLRGTLFGLYLHGAVVFEVPWPLGDLDFHAVVTGRPAGIEREQVAELHERLAVDFPSLGDEMDVYYILLDAARLAAPPHHVLRPAVVDKSWALHRAHMRAGRCVVLRGPKPRDLFPAPSWEEIDSALLHELDYVAQNLGRYPAYCVLNLCRLMYSYGTRDVVVSKYDAATWARECLGDWAPLIDSARRRYARMATKQDERMLSLEVERFFDFSSSRIRRSRERPAR